MTGVAIYVEGGGDGRGGKAELRQGFDALLAPQAATRTTQKGSYGKIRHASELLKRIRPEVVAARCASFQQFAQWLGAVIVDG